MKYDFFKDFNHKHHLDCYNIYSELFNGVKFVPKTYYLVTDNIDEKGNSKGYICVDVIDPYDKHNIVKLYISVFKESPLSYHVHDVFFMYEDVYFVISNIHYENDGLSYVRESYSADSVKLVCESKKTRLPKPQDFKELGIEASFKEETNIPHYFKPNFIGYVIESYCFQRVIEEARFLLEQDSNEQKQNQLTRKEN